MTKAVQKESSSAVQMALLRVEWKVEKRVEQMVACKVAMMVDVTVAEKVERKAA